MKTNKIDIETWQKKLKHSNYRTAFNDARMIEFVVKHLGGKYLLYHVVDRFNEWLLPVFYDQPWTSQDGEFATSCVGYGGPIPLHNVINADFELQSAMSIIKRLEQLLGKMFIRGCLYPARHWDYINNTHTRFSDTLLITLKNNVQDTFTTVLTGNVRTAIRKAERSNVQVISPVSHIEILKTHKLIEETQLFLGASYSTPLSIIEEIFNKNDLPLKIFIAKYVDEIIGTVVLIDDPIQPFHWLHGWDRNYSDICANQLMIWKMIESCIGSKSLFLNLGASHKIEQFKAKQRWGAQTYRVPILTMT